MQLLFVISILAVLFITTSTAPFLHIKEVVTASFTPMVIYILITLVKKPSVLNDRCNKEAYKVIFFGIIILLLKYSIGQDYFKSILQFIFIPMSVSIVFESLRQRQIKTLKYLIISFFILECSLAIFEKIIQVNIFNSYAEEDITFLLTQEAWEFRSTSFLGFPLANAMVVTTILSFLLLDKQNGILNKIFLTLLGYVSLFCFNARGATIIATIFILPYLLFLIGQLKNRKIKKILFGVIIIVGFILSYYILNSSLGGRLLNEESIVDGSARSRMDVFRFYKYLTIEQLLWGAPDLYNHLMNKLQAGGVENGVIVIIINYGLIFTMILLPLLICFHYKKLSVYNKFERVWIMFIFYTIGTMNPNLASPTQWIMWLLAYYTFRNKTFKKGSLSQKELTNKFPRSVI